MVPKLRLPALALLVLALGAACHTALPPRDNGPHADLTKKPPGPPAPGLLPSQVIGKLDDESAMALFARRGADGLVFFATGGRLFARSVGADGAPKQAALDVGAGAHVAQGLGSLKATADGYLAVWVELVERNHAIKLLAFDPSGKPRGETILIAQTGDSLRWVDVLPNAKSATVVWEIPRGDRTEVDVVPLVNGKPNGATILAVKDALGWEGIATEKGFAVAAVMADTAPPVAEAPKPQPKKSGKQQHVDLTPSEPSGAGKVGRVVLTEFDAAGRASTPIVVSPTPTAQIDLEIVQASGKYLLAWTDERDLDACVYVASVEPGGKIASPPHRATSPFGEQALVTLVGQPFDPSSKPEGTRALLAWEDLQHAQGEARLIHLASLDPDATLHLERARLALATPNGPPDIVPDGEGWTATTLAPVPEASEAKEGPKDHAAPRGRDKNDEVTPIWPSFARFGADLAVRGAEPVRAAPFPPDFVPYVTRGLSCRSGTCLTLASSGDAGALALVGLPTRPSKWTAAAQRDADEGPPRATSLTALSSGDHLAKVAAAEFTGGAKLAAWVTYFIEGGKTEGKASSEDAPAARLEVRPIAAGTSNSAIAAPPVLISQKAISLGGVALAVAPSATGRAQEAVLGWVAKERGEPQVFVTKLGPDGKKLAQKGVTVVARKKRGKNGGSSEVSDVAVAFDGTDGFIVAWVDTRDGNAEIYVAKVDRSMTKVVPDKRITEAPAGTAGAQVIARADVQIVVRGRETWLAWSDSRENPTTGRGDVYLARLETASLKKLAPETRVFAANGHCRSPQFSPAPNGRLVLSWIEQAPEGKQGGRSGADSGMRVSELDDRGNLIGKPLFVRPEGDAAVTSATMACATRPCRGVLTSATADAVQLQGFELEPGGRTAVLKTIAALSGGTTEDPSPAFASGDPASLFFADDSPGGQGRVRWMQIAW